MAANEWSKKIKKKKKSFENRRVDLLAEDISGKSVFLCRYITEQEPPKDVVDLK